MVLWYSSKMIGNSHEVSNSTGSSATNRRFLSDIASESSDTTVYYTNAQATSRPATLVVDSALNKFRHSTVSYTNKGPLHMGSQVTTSRQSLNF